MRPEFYEKLEWARYLQLQHDIERRQEKARMARIEEELKKEEENKDIEEKYMNYEFEVEEQEEEKPKESTDWSEVVFAIVYWGGLFGLLIYATIRVVNGG